MRRIFVVCSFAFAFPTMATAQDADWSGYLGGPESAQYSTLDQINTENVGQLEVAWTYHTGGRPGQIQCNPLVINGVLYGTTPTLKAFALDAATGEERWTFDPMDGRSGSGVARGLVYWPGGNEPQLFVAAMHHLFALDPETGKPIESFGDRGRVDLKNGLGRNPSSMSLGTTTPGVIYNDLLILGMRVGENHPSAPGYIRAYDVRTGEIRWTFHTVPQPGEFGYDTWPPETHRYTGGANSWAGMSLDAERGLVYVPTGSAAYDFYGADRHGENLFANTLLALDAATGERRWHFQTVHHDLWDRDLPAPPNLLTVEHEGQRIDAVAQITKNAYVFLFNRETGEPLFEIEERPAPKSDLPGEYTHPTQPVPVKPTRFSRHRFDEGEVSRRTPEVHAAMLAKWGAARKGHDYDPPSTEGTLIFPGYDGGGEWGGAAVDPETGILYVNASEMPWILTMVPAKAGQRERLPFARGADEPWYLSTGYNRFLDDDGYPGIAPPWGTLNAVDLNRGEIMWKVTLGHLPDAKYPGGVKTGTENYGGPVVTAGGVLFIGATKDKKFRAFDKTNGTVLWEADLPAAGYATPSTYSVDGRQYVVIAAGGGKIGSKGGDAYVAFALSRN